MHRPLLFSCLVVLCAFASGVACGGAEGTATPVLATATITVSANSLSFAVSQGNVNPPGQSITITNGGGGTLSGLSIGTITYGAGADRKSVV